VSNENIVEDLSKKLNSQEQSEEINPVDLQRLEYLTMLEEKADELAELYRIAMEFPRFREFLLRISRGKIPVNLLVDILVHELRRPRREAEIMINDLIKLGLLIPRSGDKIITVVKKKRVKGCKNVYCSLDTPSHLFEKCCEFEEFEEIVLQPSPVLQKLVMYFTPNP